MDGVIPERTAVVVMFVMWALGLILGIVLLGGCGSIDGKTPERESEWRAITVPAPDGQPVLCIVNYMEDAISCDWAHR